MRDEIDYLALERKNHSEGSYNGMVKELVVAARHVREGIPATEIKSHMPHLYELEKKLHKLDSMIGEPRKEYVQEIWEVLENEPQPDDTKYFSVCELTTKDDEIVLVDTGYSFPKHIIAEEWIREPGHAGKKFVILEVIQPE